MLSPRFHRWRQARRSAGARAERPAASAPRRAALCLTAAALLGGCGGQQQQRTGPQRFDGEAAIKLVQRQVGFGQRPAGSPALRRLSIELRADLPHGRFEAVPGHPGLRNVVGTLPGRGPALLIAAHYDTEFHPRGFVGANDGAAGTAAVIGVARALRRDLPPNHREVRFLLFDGEEEPPGCPDSDFSSCALRGSTAYARAHSGELREMVLLDYIAGRDELIRREGNSDPGLWGRLLESAERVGARDAFSDADQLALLDDHYPFIRRGVPAIDLIDFSYPYRDSVEDTPDKLSARSLDAVGETVTELAIELVSPGG